MNFNYFKNIENICYAYFLSSPNMLVGMHNLLGHVFLVASCPSWINHGVDYFLDRSNSLHYERRIKIYQTLQLQNCILFNVRISYEA